MRNKNAKALGKTRLLLRFVEVFERKQAGGHTTGVKERAHR